MAPAEAPHPGEETQPAKPAVEDRPSELAGNGSLLLHVGGMSCAGCVRVVEQTLLNQPGVVKASVTWLPNQLLWNLPLGSSLIPSIWPGS